MRLRIGAALLVASFGLGLAPVASVQFGSSTLESNLLAVSPSVSALLFVSAVLFGLAGYLRRSALASAAAAVSAAIQWLPVLSVSTTSAALLDDYAQLSGVDLSAADVIPGTILIFPTLWILPLLSIGLAAILLAETRNRLSAGVEGGGRSRVRKQPASSVDDQQTDLWKSQLLESRSHAKETDAS